MSNFDYWLDRTAVAVAAPPVDATPPERSTAFDSVSRSDLLRGVAQRLPMPPRGAIGAEPLEQSLREIPRSTALKTFAAAVALLCGIRLTGPPAASAATVAECKSACNGMFAKANAERVARCEGGPNFGKKVFDSLFKSKDSTPIERGLLDAVCYSWGATATALEWNECRDQCDLTQKAKPPAPACPPAAHSARAKARGSARSCADLAPPQPTPNPPGSDCTPNSCAMVGGVCCGAYMSPQSGGGCIENCSACINPAVSSC